MKIRHRHVLSVLLLASTIAVVALAVSAADAAGPSINAGPQAGIVWTHGLTNAAGHARHTSSPNLLYHGGPVMNQTTEVYPIFWGTSFTSGVISGIDSFYGGVGSTNYARTNTEYTNSLGQVVSSGVHANAHVTDTSSAPTQAPQTSAILAEVARMHPDPTPNAYYPVYIDQPRGHAGYCAWHSAGTINGVNVQFAFFFKLDNDPGCNPQSPTNQSEGLQALGNVSGHELSEMMTDPQLNAWYDSGGAENADKCAWTFGAKLLNLGGTSWKIQGNWSNSAYTANRGYTDPSSGFTRGCIDGTN
jgi:opacity protein-like surface antigen